MAEPLVRFVNVRKTYDGRNFVVHALDLEVARREFLTLLGPSGSGKTTTLMMLAGFEAATAGDIVVDGQVMNTLPPERRGIGMVFQNYALFPHLSVAENVAFPLVVRRVPKPEIAERVAAALAMVRLEGFADRRPSKLSGGQQQRVALARAVVFEPKLVLLDEPLGALDRQLREQMQYELKQLHARLGVTMVYVTHDQEEALIMSDRVAVFNDGRLYQVAPPQTLYEEPDSLFVAQFLGESNALPGSVTARDGTLCRVAVDGGGEVLATAVGVCGQGSRVTVVLRPERVRVGGAAQGCVNRFAGRPLDLAYLGDQLRGRLAVLGRDDFLVKLPNDSAQPSMHAGQDLPVGWRAEDCRALAA